MRDGRTDFDNDPQRAKANLYHARFRSDDERLSYALSMFRQSLAFSTGAVDPDELFATLVTVQVQLQNEAADLVVHSPPTRAERRRWSEFTLTLVS